MARNQLAFVEGASINKNPMFYGVNYPFWKVRMKIFMESVNRGIWQAVVNGYTIPTQVVNNETIEKLHESWSIEEIRRSEYDSKAMNIIYSSLNSDEFFRVSACTIAKEMRDLIKVTHEGTLEIRRAWKNSLIQKYETFKMKQGETIGYV